MKNIQRIFMKCKKLAMEQKLPISKYIDDNIQINNRYKRKLATCSKENNKYYISINSHILNSDNKVLEEIILHELIHTIKGCFNHGKKFKHYCSVLNNAYGYNISTYCNSDKITYTEMNVYKYSCPYCHKIFTAYKKPSSGHRICTCGHDFFI